MKPMFTFENVAKVLVDAGFCYEDNRKYYPSVKEIYDLNEEIKEACKELNKLTQSYFDIVLSVVVNPTNNLKTKIPVTYKAIDITIIKIYARTAVFFKQGNTGMMLRIDSCDENCFRCRDENSEVRRHEIIDIPYSSVDLDKDTFYKLAAINY